MDPREPLDTSLDTTDDLLTERLRAVLPAHYALAREVGRGGMATVYVAEDLKHRRRVAVKVLDPGLSAGTAPDRFRKEIEIAARLQHPHIVALFDSGAAHGILYYIMPLVEGESLRTLLERDAPLAIEDVLRLGGEIADALDYAHRMGVVHRDIKPANILLAGTHALVADFGIARAIGYGAEQLLTQTGTTIGTPAYMSPEQATAPQTVDGRSDQYSLACVLFECLTGRQPFRATDPAGMLLQHIGAVRPLVSEFRSGVPPGVVQAIRRAMAKAPGDRFRTVWEFYGALRAPSQAAPSLTVDRRLVVLPFESLGAAEDEYFADGITDEITSRLSSLRGLGVIARTSAGQYRKTSKSVREISEELDVSYLLAGSVRWSRQSDGVVRIRVTPQLIRASDGVQIWAERYDAVLAEVFQIQSQIAVSVATALDLNLIHAERVTLERCPTEHVEAYQAFLRANEYMSHNPLEGERRIAQGLYERAVELDARFAVAHAALSKVHASMFWFNYDRTPERLRLAKMAADRALEIAPGLPEAHIALGWYYSWGNRDYVRALEEFAIAARTQTNSAEVHYALGTIFRRLGRFSETVEEIRTAVDLDPRVPARRFHLGITYTVLGRFEQAAAVFERVVSSFPDDPVGYIGLAHLALAVEGDVPKARRHLLEAGRLVPPGRLFGLLAIHDRQMLRVLATDFETAVSQASCDIHSYLGAGDVYRRLGRRGEAKRCYGEALSMATQGLAEDPENAEIHMNRGLALAGLGNKKEAIRAARQAMDLLPPTIDAWLGQGVMFHAAEIHASVKDFDGAMSIIERMEPLPAFFTPALLRTDPWWIPAHGNPGFERILDDLETRRRDEEARARGR